MTQNSVNANLLATASVTYFGASSGVGSGANSVSIGGSAGNSSMSGGNNTIIGQQAGVSLAGGGSNTLIGRQAGTSVAGGSSNTLIGSGAGDSISSGSSNTAIGLNAGNTNSTGSNNITIGSNSDVSGTGSTNQIIIGNSVTGTADNQIVIGTSATTIAQLNGAMFSKMSVAAINTTNTMTGSNLLGGIITTNGTGITLTTDSAANIYSSMGSPTVVGTTLTCMIVNTGGINTLGVGSNVTNSLSSTVLAATSTRILKFVLTATTPTFTVYG